MTDKYSIQDFLEIKSAVGGSFSPNGERVAFRSNANGVFQLYIAARDGDKAEQLTFYHEPLTIAEFSPTKDEIVFGMGEGGNEKVQLYLYDIATKSTRRLTHKQNCIYRFGDWSKDGKLISYSSNEKNGTDFDVYVMDVASGNTHMVFAQGGWCDALDFSPSGKKLVVRKQHTFVHHDLYLVDRESGGVELITPYEGNAEYGAPAWLPDELGFFFRTNEGRDRFGVSFHDSRKKTAAYVLTPQWDISQISLSHDGANLTVISNEDGYSALVVYDAKTLRPIAEQSFPRGIINRARWSCDGEHLAFAFESVTRSKNVWIWSKNENRYWPLTHLPSRVPEETFVEPELIQYASFDGLNVPAFLFLPQKRIDKIPVIINIHGGPEEQYRPVFDALTQYFTYRGYAVVAPNVRGSAGYGKRYLALDDRDKRMDAIKDIVALHTYLKTRKEINAEKTALIGASYGGYMTLACLAFFPNLWVAGIDIVGFSNLVTFLENTAVWRRALREAEYGFLKTDRKLLEKISPFNFVQNIKAPFFIIHGKNDPRVPVAESEQMYRKLREHGVPTELLIYADEGHGLSKLKNRRDAFPRVADFLDKHLK